MDLVSVTNRVKDTCSKSQILLQCCLDPEEPEEGIILASPKILHLERKHGTGWRLKSRQIKSQVRRGI